MAHDLSYGRAIIGSTSLLRFSYRSPTGAVRAFDAAGKIWVVDARTGQPVVDRASTTLHASGALQYALTPAADAIAPGQRERRCIVEWAGEIDGDEYRSDDIEIVIAHAL